MAAQLKTESLLLQKLPTVLQRVSIQGLLSDAAAEVLIQSRLQTVAYACQKEMTISMPPLQTPFELVMLAVHEPAHETDHAALPYCPPWQRRGEVVVRQTVYCCCLEHTGTDVRLKKETHETVDC